MSKGLGRTPPGFKANHVCAKCESFGPLWDLTYTRWCDECVRSNGGLLAAGKEVQEAWRTAADERREQNGLKPIHREPAPEPTAPAVTDASVWKRAESLHKAMKCTIEEAYERLLIADDARRAVACTPTPA